MESNFIRKMYICCSCVYSSLNLRRFVWYIFATEQDLLQFKLSVRGQLLSTILGCEGKEWMWQSAGKISVRNLKTQLKLHDLTGFNGRCDAIFNKKSGYVSSSKLGGIRKKL